MRLEAHQLEITRGAHTIVDSVSFTLQSGEALWVTGSNGSGKTSLLRVLCGLSEPSSGEVLWNEKPRDEQFLQGLLYCGHVSGIKDDLTALENVLISSRLSGKPCSEDDALRALQLVGLEHKADLVSRSLSMGQRKRVALARLCIHPLPHLLILDEPFSALDQTAVENLVKLLKHYLARGGMLIYTSHQEISLEAQRLDLSVPEAEVC